jgi:hypothetical protein
LIKIGKLWTNLMISWKDKRLFSQKMEKLTEICLTISEIDICGWIKLRNI